MKEKMIEEILDISMISCPNNCKEGICIVYKNTVDEGTVLCPVCGGSGRIDYTNEMKTQQIKELIKAKLPKERELNTGKNNYGGLFGQALTTANRDISIRNQCLSDVVKIVEEL